MTKTETEKAEKRRGRPRKARTSAELAAMKKPKLTLAEKQAIKLKAQKAKQAAKRAKGELEPKNKDRFYCTNKELQAELIKWRDSAEKVEDRIPSEELGRMILAIGYFTSNTDMMKHKILCKHIFNISIYLSYGINILSHTNFAKTPLIKAGEPSVPYFFASSTASLIATPFGTFSSK